MSVDRPKDGDLRPSLLEWGSVVGLTGCLRVAGSQRGKPLLVDLGWTGVGDAGVQHRDPAAGGVLVGLGTPQGDDQALVIDLHVVDVEADEFAAAKMAAMKAHATQIAVDGPFFALSNNVGNQMWGAEFFRLAKGVQGTVNEDGLETDLFAGLE